MSAHDGALEAVDRILNRGGDPEAVLRDVVSVLRDRVFARVTVAFAAEGGRQAGKAAGAAELRAPVVWDGTTVGELRAEAHEPHARDAALLERVATLVSPQMWAASRRRPDAPTP